MLLGLSIRELVLIREMELVFGPGLTVLTGETGAGKSIVLGALGLATGARAEPAMVRLGAAMASATALFALPGHSPAWAALEARGLKRDAGEDLILRRTIAGDGRSRAFVDDQPAGVAALRAIGEELIEVHGQHETHGLLDARTHLALLDAFGALHGLAEEVRAAWGSWRAAREEAAGLQAAAHADAQEVTALAELLGELDRLSPQAGEETALAQERALLGAAEKTLADIEAARLAIGGEDAGSAMAGALNALVRAGERARAAGANEEWGAAVRLRAAEEAASRALAEIREAESAIGAAAAAFAFEPSDLERTEERLFALRGLARRLNVVPDELGAERLRIAQRLAQAQDAGAAVEAAVDRCTAARTAYLVAAARLGEARRVAASALSAAVAAELAPLKLEKARFSVAVEPLPEERAGPAGLDRVEFQVATLPGAPLGPLSAVASGGELARLALALKVRLAQDDAPPVMIFDEIDAGVGGAAADAVGRRLARLAASAQVLVVTHSPQIAARAAAHWKVTRTSADTAEVEVLSGAAREEEIARMLSGETITAEARAAARALIHA